MVRQKVKYITNHLERVIKCVTNVWRNSSQTAKYFRSFYHFNEEAQTSNSSSFNLQFRVIYGIQNKYLTYTECSSYTSEYQLP